MSKRKVTHDKPHNWLHKSGRVAYMQRHLYYTFVQQAQIPQETVKQALLKTLKPNDYEQYLKSEIKKEIQIEPNLLRYKLPNYQKKLFRNLRELTGKTFEKVRYVDDSTVDEWDDYAHTADDF